MKKTIPTAYFVIAIAVVLIILGVIYYHQVIYKPETPLMTNMYPRTPAQKSK